MGCWSARHLFVVATFLIGVQGDSYFFERSSAKFLLTVPTKPHYDSLYTATVTGFEVTAKESVELVYKGLKDSSRIINTTILWFEEDGVQNWTVSFPWDLMEQYGEIGVTLTMSTLFGEESKTLYFNRDTGYILIQTDKPVYTPRQTVKFRIIAVDEYERLAKYPLKVDIKNERAIVVDRMHYTAMEAFKAQEFELPKETPPGNWTISANFEGMDHVESKVHSVNFEVKEYVLPRFSAEVKISTDVITKSTNWITITVAAKYVYGYYLLGSVEIQLGIWDPRSGLQLLPQKNVSELTKGQYKDDFRVSNLIPTEMIVRGGKRLYVAVNVTELGTGENVTIVDTSTFIAHPYYDITYTDSKKHFRPGFDYTLHTQVRARSGRPASWVKMWIGAEYKDVRGRRVSALTSAMGQQELDENGKNVADFSVPANAHTIKFKTYVLDFKAGSDNVNELTVPKLESHNRQYLHIKVLKAIERISDGLVRLQYTPPESDIFDHKITLTVLSKGHIVYVTSVVRNTDGQSLVSLPKRLYNQVSPSMRVVASYYHSAGSTPEFVIDSLNVDTVDVCVEELSVAKPMFSSPVPKKPKDNYKLVISGGPGMHVGMVAVDEAVLLLNDRHTLTRESMFQQLGSHDQGTGIGDGVDMVEVMKNSGLVHLFVDNSFPSWERIRQRPDASHALWEGSLYRRSGGPYGNGGLELNLIPDDRIRNANNQNGFFSSAPPETARKYFPESWLFKEFNLPRSGVATLNMTLPDSITTWSFMAVGLSANRGICVSSPLQQKVQKMFFVDVRMPYKVTRLEEVKVKIAVYNYHLEPIEIVVKVTGSHGLCFSANRFRGTEQNSTSFNLKIGKKRAKSRDIKVIPLENGELTLRVDAYNPSARDIVEKKIYVVAEGLRMRKSLTFVLDPEAKHATFNQKRRRKVMLSDTATIKNSVDVRRKTQKTEIDLAMPKEVIRGTQNCKISAFGDLMGDIITHAVVKSKSLMEHSIQNAEEVLGDLGPTVHALLYANMSGLMDQELAERARKFVRHGVARLLRYRMDQAFAMTPTSQEATWLTTAVLKTLCQSSHLAFIDKALLIDHGFYWLLSQVTENGTLRERDWRLVKNDSTEYQVMLSAEVLIAIVECERHRDEDHISLMAEMAYFLEINLDSIQNPMVLAKVTYALTLQEALIDRLHTSEGGDGEEGEGMEEEEEEYPMEEEEYPVEEEEGEETVIDEVIQEPEVKVSEEAVKRLAAMAKKNRQGQVYWSSEEVTNEDKAIPFWYRKGVKASAIEATAFSLLVFLNHPGANVDAIADWLVAQRNQHGSFIGARDSVAAIQALSAYSLRKSGLTVDLSCNVTSDKTKQYSHSFKFTQLNAIQPESLNDVPVGHSLEVLTKGHGLGQMQINVEYNVPIDPNEKCDFNVTVEVKRTELNFFTDMHDDPMCKWCRWSCRPIIDNTTLASNSTGNDTSANSTDTQNVTVAMTTTKTTTTPVDESPRLLADVIPVNQQPRRASIGISMAASSSNPGISISAGRKNQRNMFTKRGGRFSGRRRSPSRKRTRQQRKRSRRSVRSRTSICIKVCLQHVNTGTTGETRVDIDMLTGHRPVDSDIERIKELPEVVDAVYVLETDSVVIVLKEVSDMSPVCVGFRAVDHEEVDSPTPANVMVTEVGNPAPSCALEYKAPAIKESLQVYCADFSNRNRGECRCYSGLCSTCNPNYTMEPLDYAETKNLVCSSDVGYQVDFDHTDVVDRDQWVEIDARILSVNKTGTHQVNANDTIKMMSPVSCLCPTFFRQMYRGSGHMYMLSSDVEKMVDRFGNVVRHYLLDEQSTFVMASHPESPITSGAVPHMFLNASFDTSCP